MVIFFLAAILLSAFCLVGWLFFALKKEAAQTAEPTVVPWPADADRTGQPSPEALSLQAELAALREEAARKERSFAEETDALRQENERLRREASSSTKTDEDLVPHLRAENVALKAQMESSVAEARELSAQLEVMKKDLAGLSADQKIAEDLEALRQEKEAVEARLREAEEAKEKAAALAREESGKEIDGLRFQLETLRRECDALKASSSLAKDGDQESLRQEKDALEGRLREMEQGQSSREEELRFLQYELTKSRAQAAGFERICEGSKKRLEDMDTQTREARKEQTGLQAKVAELERSLGDFRKISAGLLQKPSDGGLPSAGTGA